MAKIALEKMVWRLSVQVTESKYHSFVLAFVILSGPFEGFGLQQTQSLWQAICS